MNEVTKTIINAVRSLRQSGHFLPKEWMVGKNYEIVLPGERLDDFWSAVDSLAALVGENQKRG